MLLHAIDIEQHAWVFLESIALDRIPSKAGPFLPEADQREQSLYALFAPMPTVNAWPTLTH